MIDRRTIRIDRSAPFWGQLKKIQEKIRDVDGKNMSLTKTLQWVISEKFSDLFFNK